MKPRTMGAYAMVRLWGRLVAKRFSRSGVLATIQ